jgi:hypothetical protein
VTRPKQSAVIIGDQLELRNYAQKKLVDRHRTFLSITAAGFISVEAAAYE